MWISLDILYLGWLVTRAGLLDLGRFRTSYSPDLVDALSLISASERLRRLDKTSAGSLNIPICKLYIYSAHNTEPRAQLPDSNMIQH